MMQNTRVHCTMQGYFIITKNGVFVCVLNRVQLFVTPWTVAHQAPLSMEFCRQEHRSGLAFSTLRDLHDPGIESVLAGGFFTTALPETSATNTFHKNIRDETNS